MKGDINKVVEGNYCVGCGACAYASKGVMKINKYGEYVPDLTSEVFKDEETLKKVESVCPFLKPELNENVLGEEFLDGKSNYSDKIGFYEKVYAGYVTEKEFRNNGTSGGSGTWVGAELLRLGLIDGVIHVKRSERINASDPFYKYGLSTTQEEIKDGAKSKYHVVEVSEILNLIKDKPGKYLFIGVPCLVKSIRRIQKIDPIIKEKIAYTVSLVCGHFKSINWSLSLGWAKGIQPEMMDNIQYRTKGDGIPARKYIFRAWKKGSIKDNYIQADSAKVTGGKFNQGALMLPACNFCDDVVGETADLTIGDAWLPQFEADDNGTNLLIFRNKKILKVFEDANEKKQINIIEISEKDAINSQSGGFRQRGEGLAHRIKNKEKQNKWVPDKRVKSSDFKVSYLRKKIYSRREDVTMLTRESFLKALEFNDYNHYYQTTNKKIENLRKLELFSIFFKALKNKAQRKYQKLIKK
ncbi:MAG: Coenzyme F420 hydrogenase/dehydrogenase, beta subunit C-terminal domain [Polaribacter sp.]|uniref:Coenzyme F420 hydrogenase/dehydrogenase, beta subunit C-terminal domain n=1 Tax=Polaribacter sp. TaxID=1920175 RepID=UPI003EFA6C88